MKGALFNGRMSYTLRFYTPERDVIVTGNSASNQPVTAARSGRSIQHGSDRSQTSSLHWLTTSVELALAWELDRESFHVHVPSWKIFFCLQPKIDVFTLRFSLTLRMNGDPDGEWKEMDGWMLAKYAFASPRRLVVQGCSWFYCS